MHDAELELEVAKLDMEKARDKLSKMRLLLREQTSGKSEENACGDLDSRVWTWRYQTREKKTNTIMLLLLHKEQNDYIIALKHKIWQCLEMEFS